AEADEADDLDGGRPVEPFANRAHSDPRGLLDGVAVRAGADRGERDGAESAPARQIEARLVAAAQQLGFARATSAPDRPHRVDDVPRGQPVPPRQACLPGGTAAQGRALLE